MKYNVLLSFNGTSNFFNNLLHSSGAVCALEHWWYYGTNFSNNLAKFGGTIYAEEGYSYYDVVLTFKRSNNFNNSASIGGVIYACGNSPGNVVLTLNGNNNFISNAAHYARGASSKGGAIHADTNTFFSFSGDGNFIITLHNLVVQLT